MSHEQGKVFGQQSSQRLCFVKNTGWLLAIRHTSIWSEMETNVCTSNGLNKSGINSEGELPSGAPLC